MSGSFPHALAVGIALPLAKPAGPSRIVRQRLFRSRRCHARRGVAAVEFAILAPLFFLLIFGMIESGRAIMVQQVLVNASREGSRRAVIEDATVEEVKAVVTDYLAGASVAGTTVTVSPGSLSDLGFGDPVTVSVSVPYSSVSWLPSPWFMSGKTLAASSTMRGERMQ